MNTTSSVLEKHQKEILSDWLREQLSASTWRPDLMSEAELRQQSAEFLSLFVKAMQSGEVNDINSDAWTQVREMLETVSRSRSAQGFSPVETATFIFSLKQPLFARLREALKGDIDALTDETWQSGSLLDKLGLYTTEAYQKSRESIIGRQQQEMLELSTPAVRLWADILALPLIGTLDSARTQVVMETLLQKIVETGATIAIIDITGVPTVDTLVAQHLIKTVSAARLMGTDCIISGIRPQIAQTIVHLGVELTNVITKSSLADAFILALQRNGYVIRKVDNQK